MNKITKTEIVKEVFPFLCFFPTVPKVSSVPVVNAGLQTDSNINDIFLNKEKIVVIWHKDLLFSLNCLKYHIHYQYKLLSCISGVDLIDCQYRFCVVYDLLSLTYNSRLRVKVFVNEITSVDSLVNLYINSNWWEREIWDLYGIYFNNHPDLRRILTDYGFEGYPMRKDFPLSGHIELKYDQNKKRIVVEPLQLSQEFRSFSYEIPW